MPIGKGRARWFRRRRTGPSRETMAHIEMLVREETRRLYGPAGTQRNAEVVPPIPRRRSTSRGPTIALAAISLVGATAIAGAIAIRPDSPTVPLNPDAAAGVAESPTIAGAPWLFQRQGSPHILTVQQRGSLQLKPGTRYGDALDRLLRSVAETGTIPAGLTVAAPLPRGVVWQTGTRTRGPRLDLTAPWGYTLPTGKIRTPTLRISRSVGFDEASALGDAFIKGTPVGKGRARALRADTPRLSHCQIQTPRRPYKSCRIQRPMQPGA